MKRFIRPAISILVILAAVYTGMVIGYNMRAEATKQPVAQSANVQSTPPTASELLKLVNAERAKHGVAPLKEDARLDASAQMKANDMVEYGYFGHISPANSPYADEHGYELISTTGIKCSWVSENIYWGREHNTAQGALNWWMNSKPHREALLDSKYSYTGFGIAENKVVEHFCRI